MTLLTPLLVAGISFLSQQPTWRLFEVLTDPKVLFVIVGTLVCGLYLVFRKRAADAINKKVMGTLVEQHEQQPDIAPASFNSPDGLSPIQSENLKDNEIGHADTNKLKFEVVGAESFRNISNKSRQRAEAIWRRGTSIRDVYSRTTKLCRLFYILNNSFSIP